MTQVNFKFYYLNADGQAASFLAKKGELNNTELILDGDPIPIAAIAEADVRNQILVLVVATEDAPITLAIKTSSANSLKSHLGILRSTVWTEQHKKALSEQGQAHRFRQVDCPVCHATLDLTDMATTPQVHCQFCDTLSTVADRARPDVKPESESGHRLCDECGMYSRPRKFTIFYFYFLFVFYGWSSQQTWRCPACMRGEAWKMLFGNMLFLIGLPVAIIQLFRAYGGADIGGKFKGLDAANIKARTGKIDDAIAAYRSIMQQNPVAAGVKYNLGLAFAQQERLDDASKMFEFSLKDCSNYAPAASMLAHCYDSLGKTDELAELKRIWASSDEDEEADVTASR